jgi:major membrane immunogen (membrane-anchored lipoprotein)
MKKLIFIAALAALLSACGESPQTLVKGSGKHDDAAYTGTGKTFVEAGWKQGDKASWESQLKARNQYGQNDYSRMN